MGGYIKGYSNLTAYTQVPNNSYFCDTHYTASAQPISGPAIGLLAMLSAFQYQAPYINPIYSDAAAHAGKAAYIESGGQGVQDKTTQIITKRGIQVIHEIGITDSEIGIVGGIYKTYKDRSININGPKIYSLFTHLTCNQNSGSIGLKLEFK